MTRRPHPAWQRPLCRAKIHRAHKAGAVIFNHQDEDEIVLMGGTNFSAVPTLSINQNDGETLTDLLQIQSDITAKISLNAASVEFNVPVTLICEHVGLQLDTTHTYRGDLRIALLSSRGYPSTLQTTNADDTAGLQPYIYGPSNTSSNPTQAPGN